MTKSLRRVAVVTALLVTFAAGSAWSANPFVDIAGNTHAANIDAIYNAGLTLGCDATHYCPNDPVTRAQMATFLARAAGFGKNNFPKANAKSDRQTYCALSNLYPGSYNPAPCQKSAHTVVATNAVGTYDSITIGEDGLPIIAFRDTTAQDLKVAHCATLTCAENVTVTSVDATSNVGVYTDIAIGADGLPIISYFDTTGANLKSAHCGKIDCTTDPAFPNSVVTLDSTGDVGRFTSIAIAGDGLPIISYHEATNGDLKIAHCSLVDCSTGASTIKAVTDNFVGEFSSIAIGSDGSPIVSFYDHDNGDLLAAHCMTKDCASPIDVNKVATAGDVGGHTSIAIGVDGLPIISYWDVADGDLEVAHCLDVACSAADLTTVDAIGDTGLFNSIAIGTNGLPVISYDDETLDDLKVVFCGKADCSTGNDIRTLDSAGNVGDYTSLAIGIDGVPVISYNDATNTNLKVARPRV